MTISISNLTISSNASVGTVIGTLTVQDAGNIIPCTFTLTKGSAGLLVISGNQLVSAWSAPVSIGHYSVRIHAVGTTTTFSGSARFTVDIVSVAPPPPPAPPRSLSPDGSVISGGTGSLQTADGMWTFGAAVPQNPGNWVVLLNGAQADGGVANEMEVANGGQLYAIGYAGWSVWQGGAWASSSGPTPPPPPPPPTPPPAPPPPPGLLQPVITVTPSPPEIPDTTPSGAVVATFSVAMSDGSPFAGTVSFGAPYYDGGGIFAISGNQIIVNPSGPGVGPNMTTVTDYFTLVATT